MKKYFYIMSIIVVCLSMCSMTYAATTLKDIKGTKYEDAVENLMEIGLVNGFPEDNTYRPNVVVTRAQIAKMMVVALGEEDKVDAAAKRAAIFSDIKSGHWAYGYVNVAKDLGIINGYPDGRFGPDDTVTYAEASTMALRALGYEDEISKSTESWPNNYISYGKKLNLYTSVGTINADKGAARGDVALILWNMLRTGVCTVTGSNNNGLIYGEGQKMLNKYKNYIYEDDAIITAINFVDDYSEASVTITGAEKTKVTLNDDDILDYYGRKLELLYNTKTKKIVFIKDLEKYSEKFGSVTDVKSKKISIEDTEYSLPDKGNILLYKTESLYDAVDAIVIMDGSTVKYVIGLGAKNVYVGFVSAINIEVDDSKGIKIKKLDTTTEKSYALIDSSSMPTKNSVILYYLNDDSELGILKKVDIDSTKSISTATSKKIVINNMTYNYDSSSYVVTTIANNKVSSMKFEDINKTEDMAFVYDYAGKTYVFVYENSVENEDEKAEVLAELKKYISDNEYLLERESWYSQDTYARFYDAMSSAKSMTSSNKLVKINEVYTELKDAKAALKSVSSGSAEGKIAYSRSQIRALIKTGDTIVKNKAQYTQASYDAFYAKYVAAKNLLAKTNNTQTEAQNMYNELNSVMSSSKLIKIVNTQAHKDALARLNIAITTYGNAGPEANYTAGSYSIYKKAKDDAVKAKTNNSTTSPERLDELALELKNAFENLKLAIDTSRAELNKLILDYMAYENNKTDYMPDTYKALEDALNNAMSVRNSDSITTINNAITALKTAKGNLKERSVVLKELETIVVPMKDASATKTALASSAINSEDQLVKITNIEIAVKTDLNNLITKAKTVITSASGDTLVKVLDATSAAQSALNGGDAAKMVDAYVKLEALLPKQN